jgi:LPS export ABC transporter protein LptC
MNNATAYSFRFLLLLQSLLVLVSCENDEAKVKAINQKKMGIEEAYDIKLNYTIGGNIKAIVKAPLMLNVQEAIPYVVFPNTLHVDFYNALQKRESKLDAKYGKYQQYQTTVFLKDSVVVINMEKGDTLYCDELYWDRNRTGSEFYTDKPVKIRTKTETLNGTGMEASQDFRNWHILNSVGSISVPASTIPL